MVDTIFIAGHQDELLGKLLGKLGYDVLYEKGHADGLLALDKKLVDLILLDDRSLCDNESEGLLIEIVNYLKSNDNTKRIPIVTLTDRSKELDLIDRLEVIPKGASVGLIASKVAMQLRMRKNDGADSLAATVGEMNANLRDINERLLKERQEAKSIQNALLPRNVPKANEFELGAYYSPLDEVGGDWYSADLAHDLLNIIIADVTGHGLAAALIGSMTKMAMAAVAAKDPEKLLNGMNTLMAPHLPEGRFITILSLNYSLTSGRVMLASGGHPPAIIWSAKKRCATLSKSKGFALGFFEEAVYKGEELHLERGDILFTFTDGLVEAQNMSGEMLGNDGISRLLEEVTPEMSADTALKILLNGFNKFLGGRLLKDDVTVLALKRVI
jgi:serine phosphatase RsbU (regulator of sigma subunit)